MQQQQGWLFGRGAFDKGDLLYLRDEADKQRHAELELRETELSQFAALKARMESQQRTSKDVLVTPIKTKSSKISQSKILNSIVKVKPKPKMEAGKRKLNAYKGSSSQSSIPKKAKACLEKEEKSSEIQ